jgi:Ca2+-binding EF-hand superfamily protein
MGGTHSFKRDDDVEGMGLQVLVDAKNMYIKSRQLDRIYHEFHKLAGDDYYTVDLEAFLAFLQVDYPPMVSILYQLLDKEKTGQMTFYQYMVYNWHFLSASDDGMAAICFQMFDIDKSSTMEVYEVKYMINAIHSFSAGMMVGWAMDKLNKNEDGYVTIAEFILLCRHFPKVIKPLVELRNAMRKKIVHTRFWKECERIRRLQFGNLNIFDILVISDHVELKQASIEHMNSRPEVPVEMRDKWLHTQDKRAVLEDKIEAIVKDLPPETLTDAQKGLREFHLNLFQPKSRRKEKKDQGNFAHLHAVEGMEEDDEAANARLNMLVSAIKEEHTRTTKSRKKTKGEKKRMLKAHKSVKATAGLPAPP